MKSVTFCFGAYPDQHFAGFAVGTTWNGFDNVCVTPEVARDIDAFFTREEPSEDPPIGADYPGPGLALGSHGPGR